MNIGSILTIIRSMNSLLNAFRNVRINSDGEEEDDDGRYAPVFGRRFVPSESDEEQDPDDFGFYDGTNAFHLLLEPDNPRITIPKTSCAIPGAIDVYTQAPFRLKAGESKVIWIGFGLVVPRSHLAVFTSREALLRSTGVFCPELVIGPGKASAL